MSDNVDAFEIDRGSRVATSDGQRVGDVIEVHPTYLHVSRGVVLVSDIYIPLHAVATVEGGKVSLSLDRAALKRMDWKHPPRTPLELMRTSDDALLSADHDDQADDDGTDSGWGATTSAAREPVTTEEGEEDLPDYWQTTREPSESVVDDEAYDTLGLVVGSRLEAAGGMSLAMQDVGQGRPIILLHDWLFSQAYWDSQVPLLVQAGYRVITMDLRGHGASDRPWDDYLPTQHVHDLRTLVRTLDLQEPTVVGHGFGAAIAVQYALTHARARVRRLILVAPAAPRFSKGPDWEVGQADETVDGWIERLRVERPTLVRHLVASLMPAIALDDATVQWLWEMAMRPPSYVLAQTLRILSALDLRDDLASLRAPVTVLQGTEDRFTLPSASRALAMAVPNAEYLPFEGVGHFLDLEARAVFEETLLGVLARDSEEDSAALLGPSGVEDGQSDYVHPLTDASELLGDQHAAFS